MGPIMNFHEIVRASRRGRFIVPTADLSAPGKPSKYRIHLSNSIIAPVGWGADHRTRPRVTPPLS